VIQGVGQPFDLGGIGSDTSEKSRQRPCFATESDRESRSVNMRLPLELKERYDSRDGVLPFVTRTRPCSFFLTQSYSKLAQIVPCAFTLLILYKPQSNNVNTSSLCHYCPDLSFPLTLSKKSSRMT
jgi:hypothetical protein